MRTTIKLIFPKKNQFLYKELAVSLKLISIQKTKQLSPYRRNNNQTSRIYQGS